jgi:hypothetical protein
VKDVGLRVCQNVEKSRQHLLLEDFAPLHVGVYFIGDDALYPQAVRAQQPFTDPVVANTGKTIFILAASGFLAGRIAIEVFFNGAGDVSRLEMGWERFDGVSASTAAPKHRKHEAAKEQIYAEAKKSHPMDNLFFK